MNTDLLKQLNVLEKKNSILHNKIMMEKVNDTILLKLIHSDLLKKKCTSPMAKNIYETEKDQLLKYHTLVKNSFAYIKYKKIKNMPYGRVQPDNGLGLINIRREIRQTLTKGTYIDIDITNCHPVIMYNLCIANGWVCTELENYINNREQCLQTVMHNVKCSRDDAKRLYIRLMYFGSFKLWYNEIQKEKNPDYVDEGLSDPQCIKKFKDEIQKIGNNIYNMNPHLVSSVEKNKEDKNIHEYNKVGTVVSFYFQEIENRILEECIKYCYENICQDDIYILCYDGFMIPAEIYKPDILRIFEKIINEKFGLVLEFTDKPMDKDYLEILDKHLQVSLTEINEKLNKNKEEGILEAQYQKYKKIVEKKYFMIESGSDFGYFDEEFNLHHHSHQKMKNIILKTYNYSIKCENGRTKGFNFLDKWTGDIDRRIYNKIVFDPHSNNEGELNLFTGFKYENVKFQKKDISCILNFIKNVVVTEEAYNYVLEWIARIIQLKRRIDQTIILYSEKHGVGKSTIPEEIITTLLGSKYCSTMKKIEDITKEFNGSLENKFFTYGNEIKAKSNSLYDDLKDIITAKTILINKKCVEAYEVNNCNNFLFTTNSYNMVKIEKDDRRISLISCVEKPFDQEVYDELREKLKDHDTMATLFDFFKNYKLSKIFKVLVTEQKKDLQKTYMPSCIKYIYKHHEYLKGLGRMSSTQLFDKVKLYEGVLKITDVSSTKDLNLKLFKIGIMPKKIQGVMIYKFNDEFIEKLKLNDETLFNEYKNIDDFDDETDTDED